MKLKLFSQCALGFSILTIAFGVYNQGKLDGRREVRNQVLGKLDSTLRCMENSELPDSVRFEPFPEEGVNFFAATGHDTDSTIGASYYINCRKIVVNFIIPKEHRK